MLDVFAQTTRVFSQATGKKYFVLVLLGLLVNSTLHAQSTDAPVSQSSSTARPFRLGFWGGYGMNTHTADFPEFAGYPVFFPRTPANPGPANFQRGTGLGLSVGVLYETPLVERLSLTARASYTVHNGLFLAQTPTLLGDIQGNVIEAVQEYRINAHLASLGADAGVKWSPLGGLYLALGIRGAWMFQSTFAQEERLLPSGSNTSIIGGFDRQTFPKVRNEQQGTIPAISPLQASALALIGYEIPLGFVRLAPEIGYMLGLTGVLASGGAWRTDQVRGGIAAMFTFQPMSDGTMQMSGDSFDKAPAPSFPQELSRDSTTIASVKISSSENDGISTNTPPNTSTNTPATAPNIPNKSAALARIGIDVEALGILRTAKRALKGEAEKEQLEEKREKSVILPTQEIIIRHNYSLLPYIFFDGERSAALPQRYARLSSEEAATFAPEKLRPSTTLNAGEHPYYHLLNIVGARMKRLPTTKLNILGGIDGSSIERENLKTARQRASAVAMYLRTVWGIDSARLVMGEARLTAKSGRSFNEQDRQAENRRVELSCDTVALLEPVQLYDTVQRSVPLRLRLFPAWRNPSDIASWNLVVRQEGRSLKEWRGDSTLPSVVDWRADDRETAQILPAVPLDISLAARTKSGTTLASPPHSLPIQKRLFRAADEEYCENLLIEKYNLILFDATKSSVAQTQAMTLKAMNTRITAKSKVLVEGFMDKSDDEEANKRLTRTRAQATAQSLKFFSRGAQMDIQGYGSQKPLYDERLPEGRMYSRTVLITIETPLSEDLQK